MRVPIEWPARIKASCKKPALRRKCYLLDDGDIKVDDNPHYLGHRQRLRDRFLAAGFAGFNDYEVVELLLTLAIPRSDVKQPAKALIARFGNLRGVLDARLEEVQEIQGIGSVAPGDPGVVRANIGSDRDRVALHPG